MDPKYSIIIPTRNRAYSIWKAISSVVNQNYKNWELLVVDGNSTDDTEKLVNSFEDERIHFIPNPNDTGVASARNKGVIEARGKYIGYLDSDDFVLKNWLFEMDQYIAKHPDKVLYMPNKNYCIKLVDNKNKTLEILHKSKLFNNTAFTVKNIIDLKIQCDTNGMIHTKKSIDKVGQWNTDLSLYEDFEFLLRFAESFPRQIAYVPKVLVSYTRAYGKDSLCSTATYSKLVENLEKVFRLHGHKEFLKDQTWYPQVKNKYQEMAKKEKLTGYGILDRIIEKYSTNK